MDRNSIPTNTVTRTLRQLDAETGNIYETVSVMSRRADQLSVERKAEISNRLTEFTSATDTLEETFENREQIEMSRYFEKLPKPTIVATEEFLAGELNYGYKSNEPEEIIDITEE